MSEPTGGYGEFLQLLDSGRQFYGTITQADVANAVAAMGSNLDTTDRLVRLFLERAPTLTDQQLVDTVETLARDARGDRRSTGEPFLTVEDDRSDFDIALQNLRSLGAKTVGAQEVLGGSLMPLPQEDLDAITNFQPAPSPPTPTVLPPPVSQETDPILRQYDVFVDVLDAFQRKYPESGGTPPTLVPDGEGGFFDAPNPEYDQWVAAVEFIVKNQDRVDELRGGGPIGSGGPSATSINDARQREEEITRIQEREEDQKREQREQSISNTFALLEGAIARGDIAEREATRQLSAQVSSAQITRDLLRDHAGTTLPEGTTHFPNAGPGSDLGGLFEAITGRPFKGFETLGTFGIDPNAITAGIQSAGGVAPSASLDPSFQAAQAALVGMGLTPGILANQSLAPAPGLSATPSAVAGGSATAPTAQAPRMSPMGLNPASRALLAL